MTDNTPEYREHLIRAGRLPEAYAAFQAAAAAEPDNPGLQFNAGMGAFLLHRWAEAAVYWTRVRDLLPDDYPIRARLIQLYELLADHAQRDAERAGLQALYARLKAEPGAPPCYPRDQFQVRGWRIIALEFFELTGPQAVRYRFLVHRGQEQTPAYRLSLGSYEFTNAVARAQGTLAPGERLFHLDEYRADGHAGLRFFTGEPSYDEIKGMVCEYIAR